MDKSIGFLGGGRVARILIGGLVFSRKMPGEVTVYDPDPEIVGALTSRYGEVRRASEPSEAAAREIVFLAVHPPVIADVLHRVSGSLHERGILVSLAPVVSIAKLSSLCGGFGRIVRMIPNAPSIIGEGYNPVAFSEALAADDRKFLTQIFSPWGHCPIVQESTLEAYAITTAMGPTYFWPQMYELAALAESFGLPRQAALEGVCEMIRGAVSAMTLSGLSGEQVQDLIPVKPLAEDIEAVAQAYRKKLTALFEKLQGKGS